MTHDEVRATIRKAREEAVEWNGSLDEAPSMVRAVVVADVINLYELLERVDAAEKRE